MDVRNKLSKVFKVLRKIILYLETYTQQNCQSNVRTKQKTPVSNMHNSENLSFII